MRLPFLTHLLDPVDESLAAMLKEAVGHGSTFQQREGYYADILRPEIRDTLPAGCEARLQPVVPYERVFVFDPYDLALVKLVVGRQKDLDLLRALLNLRLVDPQHLRQHYQSTPLGEREALTAGRNLTTLFGGNQTRPAEETHPKSETTRPEPMPPNDP